MKMRALIMDDSGSLRLQLQQVLEALGLSVDVLRSVRDIPDAEVIFVELVQQQANGFQCLRRLREQVDSALILVSGSARGSDQYWALQAGAAAVIQRPVNLQAVCNALQQAGVSTNVASKQLSEKDPVYEKNAGVQQ